MKKPVTRRKRKTMPKIRSGGANNDRYDKLYLLERVSGKTLWSRCFGLSEIKIGVTGKEVEQRRFGIDEDLPGDVVIIRQVQKTGKVYREEQRLHRKYSDKAWRPKTTGKSAGATEWFRVDGLTYAFILLDFWEFRHRETKQLLYMVLGLAFCFWVLWENKIKISVPKLGQ